MAGRFWQQWSIFRPPEHACQWRSRIEEACAELGRQGADGSQYVLIARVLRILDPEHRLAVAPPPLPPGADPLFGTLPVTAPGQPGEPS